MNDKGETRDDLRIPEGELGQKIKDEFGKEDITVIVSNLNDFLALNVIKMVAILYITFKIK